MTQPRLSYDRRGTPGIWAHDVGEAYWGYGFVHGRHRALQTLLLATAARGRLAETLLPRRDLLALDLLVHRLDLPRRGEVEAERVPAPASLWLDLYLAGLRAGLAKSGTPFELRLLVARLPMPDRAAVVSALMLSAYLGLAQGQERMERALVDLLAAGANARMLATLFAPHLDGWEPERLRTLPQGVAPSMPWFGSSGGSNAWAVSGDRSASGRPMLCGDPHLQVNQLPALFMEVRARVGDDWWLGATIPGLPGLAVGRNQSLAWSGTFACADNVDSTIETLSQGQLVRGASAHEPVLRATDVRRRFKRALQVTFRQSEHGVLAGDGADGPVLATRWCGDQKAGESLAAYMRLPTARDCDEAERMLAGAGTHSLHFVLADRGGDIRYVQLGRVPRRSGAWSGLHPVAAGDERRWVGFYEGASLPREGGRDGMIISANEARTAAGGAVLSTLPQPNYRLRRISDLLAGVARHDAKSMQAIQLDVLSPQGLRLSPFFLPALPAGPVKQALLRWDGSYSAAEPGAHAFELAYRASLSALAPTLGGELFRHLLAESELSVWWCDALDRWLADPETWRGAHGPALCAALATVAGLAPRPWGEVQTCTARHLMFGEVGLGWNRGPFALPGSRATVCQGNLVRIDGATLAVGPAYRFVTDLGDDGAWTSLPGGIDGSRFTATYTCWLDDWRQGIYHRIAPPQAAELELK